MRRYQVKLLKNSKNVELKLLKIISKKLEAFLLQYLLSYLDSLHVYGWFRIRVAKFPQPSS